MTSIDERWMTAALTEARFALELGEIPVGAVVVLDDRIIGRGHNRRQIDHDPLAHAEMLALKDAALTLGSWRLDKATIYVTLEPCPMCAGAINQARISRLVFGAYEPKTGAVRSKYQLCDDPRSPHKLAISAGICESSASQLLTSFFSQRRKV